MITTLYFSHDYNTRNNSKIKKLICKHGILGYGIFWCIVEELYNNNNSIEADYTSIAYHLQLDEEIIKSVILNFNLFIVKGGKISSLSVGERLNKRDKISQDAKKAAKAKWEKVRNNKGGQGDAVAYTSQEQGSNFAGTMQSDRNPIKEKKVNKEKEKKPNETKDNLNNQVVLIGNPTDTQLNDKLESLNKIGGGDKKPVTTDKQFPCIHLPQSEIDKFDKFGTYRKMELLKYMNLFFELWVSKGEPKTKSQQQVILDTLYKQEYPVAIDGIMKAVSGGHRTIYFDQAKIKEHAKPTMPRMDTENLKKALETS